MWVEYTMNLNNAWMERRRGGGWGKRDGVMRMRSKIYEF